jgi:hypothetical protein
MLRIHKILESLADPALDTCFPELAGAMAAMRTGLRQSAKFDLGEHDAESNNALFMTGQEIVEEGLFHLPYDMTYLEIGVCGHHFAGMFAQISEKKEITCNLFEPSHGVWALHRFGVWWDYERGRITSLRLNGDVEKWDDVDAAHMHVWNCCATLLYMATALLNQNSVDIVLSPAPERLNRARAKKNKLPLYEHHVVKMPALTKTGRVLSRGGSHASPRQHWRRGHVRVLHRELPNEKKIIIPACLINGRGFISKDYEVQV